MKHNTVVIKEEPHSSEETWESELDDANPHEQFVPITTFPVVKTEDTEEPWHGPTIKEDITIEEHEVCLDSFEQVLTEQVHGTSSSVTDAGVSAVHEWNCIGGKDPLLSEAEDPGSCKLLLYSQSEKNKETLSHSQDQLRSQIYEKYVLERRNAVPHTHINSSNKNSKCEVDVKSFDCKSCGKTFSRKISLVHHSRTHTGEKPFKCDVCNKSFRTYRKLNRHSRTHTGERPFKCDVCNKSYTRTWDLSYHSLTHTGEKFKCDVCNKSFGQSSTLSSHSRIHTGEKPFKCDVCNRSFTHERNLKRHSKINTCEKKFKCDLCNKSFGLSSTLSLHSRTHTGEKPGVCKKGYTHKGNLNRHLRTHSGEN